MSSLVATPSRRLVALSFFGALLGFTLSMVGFTSFDEVHRMFTFADLRLFLVFVGAVVLTGIGFAAMRPTGLNRQPIHKGTLAGGILFGAGWAITGACPGVIFAQLGEGQAPALASLAGAAIGTALYRVVHPRWFGWDRSTCV